MISAVTDDCCATLGFSNGRLINSIIPPKFINWHTAEGNFFFFKYYYGLTFNNFIEK